MSSNPPFAIGQKVVCLDDSKHKANGKKLLVKGGYYIVESSTPESLENFAGVILKEFGPRIIFLAKRFAPIQSQYLDIRKEIADSMGETREVPDRILTPETISQ